MPPVDWAAQGSDWGARLDGLRAASCSGQRVVNGKNDVIGSSILGSKDPLQGQVD